LDDLVAALGLAWNHRRPISRSPRRAAGSGDRFASHFGIKKITMTVPRWHYYSDKITTHGTLPKIHFLISVKKVIVVSYSYYHHTHYSRLIGRW
jgi:hypothetical protein